MEWIPWKEAAKRLGIPDQKVNFDYVYAERLVDGESWVILVPREEDEDEDIYPLSREMDRSREARHRAQTPERADAGFLVPMPEVLNGRTIPRMVYTRNQWYERPKIQGQYVVTCEEAARIFHYSRKSMQQIALQRLMCHKLNGQIWIPISEINRYKKVRFYVPPPSGSPQPLQEPEEDDDLQPVGEDVWLTVSKAAEFLAAGLTTVKYHLKKGKLPFTVRDGVRKISLANLIRFQDRRDKEKSDRNFTPEEWRMRVCRPIFRKWSDFPENDRMISLKEAAEILQVSPRTLQARFYHGGRIFVWTERPGVRGSKWFLSENQIRRYAADPLRLERRARTLAGKTGIKTCYPDGIMKYRAQWQMECGLLNHVPTAKTMKDHGDYYSTGQAARVLGVCRATIQAYRRAKRIIGCRRDRCTPNLARAFWFYKKEDIHRLLMDPEYQARRARFRKSRGITDPPQLPIRRQP